MKIILRYLDHLDLYVLHGTADQFAELKVVDKSEPIMSSWVPDPPENCHLNVKKLPKLDIFFKIIATNFHFFEKQLPLAIF